MAVALPGIAEAQLIGFLLVLARVGGLFLLAPIFSSKMIPARAKLLIAGAISLALMPIATSGQHLPSDPAAIAVLIVKEVSVGLAFAFALSMLQAAVAAGAALLDTLVGFSFAAVVDPINGQQTAVLGQFYGLVATMIFLAVGGDQLMIMGLARSYRLLPVTAFPDTGALTSGAVSIVEQVFVIGLEITAPALIAIIVTDAALGVVSRAMPQMNVFVVGLPAKLIAGFAVIGASLPFVAVHLQDDLQSSVMQALQLLRVS